jgi:DNA-binding NtrC family response regulator
MIYIYSQDLTFSDQVVQRLPGAKGRVINNDVQLSEAINSVTPDGILFDLRSEPKPLIQLERVYLEMPSIAVIIIGPIDKINGESFCDKELFWPIGPSEIARAFDEIKSDRQSINSCGLIGRSLELATSSRIVSQVAPSDINVLITGPSGVGKEMIARAIHTKSSKPSNPFIPVNVAALAPGIIESELFGHERGSFTGAAARRLGVFEQASGGIIFLDEIGEIPLEVQAKLLRVLEQHTFTRVGGNVPIKADFRLVAATNRNLAELVMLGRFREDLYYRLRVVSIDLPPLAIRKSDISPLAYHFLDLRRRELKAEKLSIEPAAMRLFYQYDWPGNVRELKNVIDSFSVTSYTGQITAADFQRYMNERGQHPSLLPVITGRTPEASEHQMLFQAMVALTNEVGSLKRFLEHEINRVKFADDAIESTAVNHRDSVNIEDAERKLIARALNEARGNRKRAAELLGIGERTLYRKMDKYGLK